ncbi:MAG: flagellar motor protein MotB [Nitrospinota bacterium]
MAGPQKKKVEEDGEGVWLISYGDMVTLMMTFFIMMLAFSSQDKAEVEKAVRSIQGALGTGYSAEAVAQSEKRAESSFQSLGTMTRQLISDGNLRDVMDVKVTDRGIVLNMAGGVLFRPGSAVVERGFKPFLLEMAQMLKKVPYKLMVEGHTDDVPPPPQSGYPSNWELSAARAAAVVRTLVQEGGVEPERFSATGYGEFRPLFAATPENRPKNRRVEIIISREGFSG